MCTGALPHGRTARSLPTAAHLHTPAHRPSRPPAHQPTRSLPLPAAISLSLSLSLSLSRSLSLSLSVASCAVDVLGKSAEAVASAILAAPATTGRPRAGAAGPQWHRRTTVAKLRACCRDRSNGNVFRALTLLGVTKQQSASLWARPAHPALFGRARRVPLWKVRTGRCVRHPGRRIWPQLSRVGRGQHYAQGPQGGCNIPTMPR